MSKVIAGNWKMNGSKKDLDIWFEDFYNAMCESEKNYNDNIPTVLICVPTIFINYAISLAEKYNSKTKFIKINIGCQDIYVEGKGAYTGNNSAVFLCDFGLKYTLVGHSERRQNDNETDAMVSKKVYNAVENNIIPILCVGESLEIREKKQHLDFVGQQVLNNIKDVDLGKIIIAYEPVWAIGTGKVPTLDEIQEVNSYLKKVLDCSDKTPVLYGGSVKSSNVKDIVSLDSVDGVLVGGASLKGEEFFNIVKNSVL
jgi:triosephosphate isomerase